jgi:hypothetical protein
MLSEQEETTQSIYWQLLREFEESKGNRASPLDVALIQGAYRHFAKISGKKVEPTYFPFTKKT